jgi:hypothetical protein
VGLQIKDEKVISKTKGFKAEKNTKLSEERGRENGADLEEQR